MPPGASRFLSRRLRDLAWGCGFSALLTPPVVYSLALEDISVSSRLGQPLQAVIPVDGSVGEALDSACFSVTSSADAALPGIGSVHLHLDRAAGQLTLRSVEPVREPISEVTIRVRCEGAPALDRTFLVVLDPPDMQAESVFARAAATPSELQPASDEASAFAPAADVSSKASQAVEMRQPRTAGMPPRRAPRPATIAPAVAIAPGSEYLTQVGDTLSDIAERVSGRPVGSLWAVAARIHARNPVAFRDDNPDRLIAGVMITIPEVDRLATDGFVARATSSAQPHALPERERDGAPSLPRFGLTTSLSQDSMDKLQVRGAAARIAANARLTSIVGMPIVTRPEELVAVHDDQPLAIERSADEDELDRVEPDELTQSGADDGVERSGQSMSTPDDVPAMSVTDDAPAVDASQPAPAADAVAAVSTVVDATAAAQPQTNTPTQGSSIRWALWVLGTLIVGGLLGGVLAGLFQLHRRVSARRRAQSQRRASGLERTIRLDHGIVVKEHPAGTPFTVDASTAEIAAIRAAQSRHTTTPAGDAEASMVAVRSRPQMLEFATEAPADPTVKMEGPITALDLELPEPSSDGSDVPTEVIEAPVQRDPRADSRQFLVDTDLLALAYKEDQAREPAVLPLDTVAELPMFPPMPHAARMRDDAFEDDEASSLDETALALWEIEEDEDTPPKAVAVARATKKR